jgi:hypothetical protein
MGEFPMNSPFQNPDTGKNPAFFAGTGFAIGEIELGLRVLTAKLRDLKQGNATGSAVQQKLAAEKISTVAGQMKMLADTLVRVSISHLNRRPRI